MKESSIFAIIRAIDPDNAPYIIQDSEIVRHFQRAAEYLKTEIENLQASVSGELKKRSHSSESII